MTYRHQLKPELLGGTRTALGTMPAPILVAGTVYGFLQIAIRSETDLTFLLSDVIQMRGYDYGVEGTATRTESGAWQITCYIYRLERVNRSASRIFMKGEEPYTIALDKNRQEYKVSKTVRETITGVIEQVITYNTDPDTIRGLLENRMHQYLKDEADVMLRLQMAVADQRERLREAFKALEQGHGDEAALYDSDVLFKRDLAFTGLRLERCEPVRPPKGGKV